MKFGIHSYSYHLAFGVHPDFTPTHPMTLFAFIERVHELGYQGIQIDPMHLGGTDEAHLNKIVEYCKKLEMFIECGTCGVEPVVLLENLAISRALGASILRTFIGFPRYDKQTVLAREIDAAIVNLKQVAPCAEEYGVRIAIENHGDVTSAELIDIIHAVGSPNVGVCPDLGNVMFTLEDPIQALECLAPFAVTTHFKDYSLIMNNWGFEATGVALGDGMIDLEAAMTVIREKTNLDTVVLEIPVKAEHDEHSSLQKEDDIMKRSAIYAREVLGIV